jgi:hypothetical protein
MAASRLASAANSASLITEFIKPSEVKHTEHASVAARDHFRRFAKWTRISDVPASIFEACELTQSDGIAGNRTPPLKRVASSRQRAFEDSRQVDNHDLHVAHVDLAGDGGGDQGGAAFFE